MSSYDVKALFTSVPVDPALNVICKKLQQDTTLHNRIPLSIPNIMSLLRFCLKSTFFTFKCTFYEQVKGAAMGSSLSQIVANLFIEDFETGALSSSPNPPRIWLRFVNDTFVIHKAEHTQQFLSHLNSLDPNIQFTTEFPDQQGFLPFLDTLTSQGPDGTLITTVYRKPTHADQYLHWDSHHSLTNKYSVYNTLSHSGWYVCFIQQLLKQENKHIWTALCRCNYPDWVFHRFHSKLDLQLSQTQQHNNTNPHRNTNKNHSIFLVIQYSQDLSENFRNMWQSRNTSPL